MMLVLVAMRGRGLDDRLDVRGLAAGRRFGADST